MMHGQSRRPEPSIARRVHRWIKKLIGAPTSSKSSKIRAFVNRVGHTDLLLVTGMGGITDAFPEYAFGLLASIELAIQYGALTAMMGQGIGPLTNPDLIARAREILPKIDFISLRERRAGEPLLKRLGVSADRIMSTGDDAIEMAYDAKADSLQLGSGLGVNLRAASYDDVDETLVARIRGAIQYAANLLDASLIAVPIARRRGEADHVTISSLLSTETGAKHDGGVLIDSIPKV